MPVRRRFRKRKPAVQKVQVVNTRRRAKAKLHKELAFPTRMMITSDYADFLTLQTAAAGVYKEQVYNMNSVFDPDRTGAGHQPYGYDTYSTLYNKYRVIRFDYRVQFVGVSATIPVACTIVCNNDSTALTSTTQAAESPYSKEVEIVIDGSPKTLSGSIYLPSFNGRSKAEYMADDIFGSQIATSPAEIMCMHIGVSNLAASVSTQYLLVQLRYHIELYDPLQLAQS